MPDRLEAQDICFCEQKTRELAQPIEEFSFHHRPPFEIRVQTHELQPLGISVTRCVGADQPSGFLCNPCHHLG
jgi:hypothetical protein